MRGPRSSARILLAVVMLLLLKLLLLLLLLLLLQTQLLALPSVLFADQPLADAVQVRFHLLRTPAEYFCCFFS